MHGRQRTALQIAERHEEIGPQGDLSKEVWMADWRAMRLPYCSIYVVAPVDGWPCKVGISTNPMKRVSSLQTACWKQLEVAWCGFLGTVKQAAALESRAHKSLTEQSLWLHGEWFDLRVTDAKDLIGFEADMAGLEMHDTLPSGVALDFVAKLYASRYGTPQALTDRIARFGKF